MRAITKNISINAPLEKVWAIWSDVEKTPEWVEGVKESKITAGTPGRGMEWEEKCAMGGQMVQMQHEVREWEAQKKTFYHTKLPMGAVMETRAEFNSTSQGKAEISVEISWELGILSMMISDEKFEEMIDKAFSKTAERLRVKSES